MMKHYFVLLGGMLFSAGLLAQQAVLTIGSDWNDAGVGLQQAWEDPAFRERAGGAPDARATGLSLELVDQPEVITDAVKATWERQKAVRLELARVPGFAYFDAKGRCVFLREGLPALSGTEAQTYLSRLIREGQSREAEIAALLDAGRTPDSVIRGLQKIVDQIGLRRAKEAPALKEAWEYLKKQDPKDTLGWQFACDFEPVNDAGRIRDWLAKKDRAAAEKHLRELNAKPKTYLSVNQRQGLMLLTYLLDCNTPAKKPAMTALLREVIALDAGTHFGIGALGRLCLSGEGPVSVPYGWFEKDVPAAGEQNWLISVGVPKTVRGPGTYELTVTRTSGKGKMSVKGLLLGDRIYGTPADLKPKESCRIRFDVRAGDPKEFVLSADFADPAGERGTLTLREVLPARLAGTRTDAAAATRLEARTAVAAYARTVIPAKVFAEICALPGGDLFLKAFFADRKLMEDFFASGEPVTSWEASLRALDAIVWHCRPKTAAERRWAAAAALNAEADPTDTVLLFREMMALRAEKQLVRGSDRLRCDQMRYALVPKQSTADQARYLADNHCVPPRQYGGVCWAAPYRLYNFFGDSIHGADYYKAWNHVYGRHEASRKVGGVCGSLSYYGSAAAKAHGVPSTPGGQPGHCAYSIWSETKQMWEIAYNVNPWTGSHLSIYIPQGGWNFSYLDLGSDLFAAPGFRDSMRALWRTETRRAAAAVPVTCTPVTCDAWEWRGGKLPVSTAGLKHLGSWKNPAAFDPMQSGQRDYVYLRWRGTLNVPQPGPVSFTLKSDDGASFRLNGTHLVGKDGRHGVDGGTEVKELEAGSYPFELHYFNYNGGYKLDFAVKPVTRWSAEQAEAYQAAAKLCPQNLFVWWAYSTWLKASAGTPLEAWQTFARAAAAGLKDHVEPAWKLLAAEALGEVKRLGGREALLALLTELHGMIRQRDRKTAEFCNYAAILDSHAALLDKDPEAVFSLFAAALPAQHGTADAFGVLMKWGGETFLGRADFAKRYVAEINALLQKSGDRSGLGAYVRNAILEASRVQNAEAFHALCDLQEALTPAKTARALLTLTDPPRAPLSEDGILRLSSTSHWDHPEFYRQVIDGFTPPPDAFHTAQETAPWAEVVLPGMAEVDTVYLMNTSGNRERLVPFTVEVSEDGRSWREVARGTGVQESYTFTFTPVKAQHVRVTCTPAKGARTFLHLRKFCVFGKKLY